MNVDFNYFAQIRQKAGTEQETINVEDGATLLDALKTIEHGDGFKDLLFAETGELRPVILLVVNEVPATPCYVLADGDCVQVFSPVAGG